MRDVEALDAPESRQGERVGERGEPLRLVGAVGAAAFGRQPRGEVEDPAQVDEILEVVNQHLHDIAKESRVR